MASNILFVKNMVCHRCILAVADILMDLSIPFQQVTIGEIHLSESIAKQQNDLLSTNLIQIGLELIDNRMHGLVEKIKQLVLIKARKEIGEREHKMKLS